MGIGTYRMDIRERVAMPSLGGQGTYRDWLTEFANNISAGPRNGRTNRYFVRDEMVVETHKIIVHTFQMGDVDDPDLYAAEPLWEWQNSEKGQWVMSNTLETPVWHRHADPVTMGHKYAITAVFETKKLSEYYLRFGKI